jgi:large subunit ribosomal protein L4
MEVPVINLAGEEVGNIQLDEAVFGAPLNEPLLHQAVLYYQNNLRQGTHSTKTRGMVKGGGKKPYRQKGTGNARQGSRTAPHYRGGGAVFGPHPRSYDQRLPRKMRRQAIRIALSTKAAGNQLVVVEDFDLEAPRTRDMVLALDAWGVDGSALVLFGEPKPNVIRSLRNIPKVKALPATSVGVLALLAHRKLVLSRDAVAAIHAQFGAAASAGEDGPAPGSDARALAASEAPDVPDDEDDATTSAPEEAEDA